MSAGGSIGMVLDRALTLDVLDTALRIATEHRDDPAVRQLLSWKAFPVSAGIALRARLQISENVGQFLIGNYFAGIWRHLSGRLTNVLHKTVLRK